MNTTERSKIIAALVTISRATSLSLAQREALRALRLIEKGEVE